MKFKIGRLLLGIWLILFGMLWLPFVSISFPLQLEIISILAIVAGILTIFDR